MTRAKEKKPHRTRIAESLATYRSKRTIAALLCLGLQEELPRKL